MVTSNGWLPHQIFTRGKFAPLQLRTKRYLQKTSSSNYIERSRFNNYRTVFFSNYWNLNCQIWNDFI